MTLKFKKKHFHIRLEIILDFFEITSSVTTILTYVPTPSFAHTHGLHYSAETVFTFNAFAIPACAQPQMHPNTYFSPLNQILPSRQVPIPTTNNF